MFKFFRKKKEVILFDDVSINFFSVIIEKLGSKYSYIKMQINKDFLLRYEKDYINSLGSYNITFNSNFMMKFINKKLPNYFVIKGIKIWNKKSKNFSTLDIDIFEGIIGGFKLDENVNFNDYDLNTINLSELNEKHFENKELDKVLSFFNDDEKVLIKENIEYTYEIELKEGMFYFFDELSDGDVIALDDKANVFLLFHDPYRVERIFSKTELIDRLKNNTLKIDVMNICNSLLK